MGRCTVAIALDDVRSFHGMRGLDRRWSLLVSDVHAVIDASSSCMIVYHEMVDVWICLDGQDVARDQGFSLGDSVACLLYGSRKPLK